MKIFEEKGYRYQKHLSTGGEGEIHLIKSVDTLFAAKIFPKLSDDSFNLINSLKDSPIPNIPKIHEIFNYDDKTIIIREYIEGNTLHDELKKHGHFDLSKAKSIILKICDTLKSLHNAQPNPIIYRDLKPENIIITPDNEVRLIDFGIARYYKQDVTRDTIIAGTKGYTAPEVLAGVQSNNRSDIYSVGLLFYEMLTGKNLLEPPFQIRPVKESFENLDNYLDMIIEKATDFNQTNRYNTIEELVYDLEHPHKIYSKKIKKTVFIAAAVLLVVALIVTIGYRVFSLPNKDYEILLDLEFEAEGDKSYIYEYEDIDSEYIAENGKLIVYSEVCGINYPIENGMTAHYKVKASDKASVCLGPYCITGNSLFDCSYHDDKTGTDYGAWEVELSGSSISANDNFVDILLYTTNDNSAIYAIIIDESNLKIAYTAYQIPDFMDNSLYLDICNFLYNDDDFIIVDSVKIIDGSLADYLGNFSTYNENKNEIDTFLNTELSDLVQIPFEEVEFID